MSNIFSVTYARGVAQKLIDANMLKKAQFELVEKIADSVGARINADVTRGVPAELTLEVANEILKEAADTGALVTGDKPAQANTPDNAASQVGGMSAKENKDRPEGEYLSGMGKSKLDTAGGEVGKQGKNPKSPDDADKTNELNKDVKTASPLEELYRKVAQTGALVSGDKAHQDNTLQNAADQVGGLSAMEQENRPQGKYLAGRGNTELPVTPAASVGQELPATETVGKSPVNGEPNNMLTEHSEKQGSFRDFFAKTAQEVAPLLPATLSDTAKVAAVKRCMGLENSERYEFLRSLRK